MWPDAKVEVLKSSGDDVSEMGGAAGGAPYSYLCMSCCFDGTGGAPYWASVLADDVA